MTARKAVSGAALREMLLSNARRDPTAKHIGRVAIVRVSSDEGANWSPIWVFKAASHHVPASISQFVEQMQAAFDVDWDIRG